MERESWGEKGGEEEKEGEGRKAEWTVRVGPWGLGKGTPAEERYQWRKKVIESNLYLQLGGLEAKEGQGRGRAGGRGRGGLWMGEGGRRSFCAQGEGARKEI